MLMSKRSSPNLNIGLSAATSYMMEKLLPAGKCFLGPHPETAGYADNHRHKILNHKDFEFWSATKITRTFTNRARQWIERLRTRTWAHFHVPCKHPLIEIRLLVKETGDYDQGRYDVQHGENPDANHEFFKLVRLCAIMFHHCANAKERDETRQKERSTQ